MIKLKGIRDLIKRNSVSRVCSMNIALPIKGKDQISAPIPFSFDCYIAEKPGDIGWREAEGDTYDSHICIYSLKELAVPVLTAINNLLTVRPSDSEYQTTLTILNTFRSEEDFVGKRILDGWLFC